MKKKKQDNEKVKVKGYKNFRKLLKYFGAYKGMIIFLALTSIIAAVCGTVTPIFTANVVNSISIFNPDALLFNAILLLVVQVGRELFYLFGWGFVASKIENNVKFDLQQSLIKQSIRIKSKSYDKSNSGMFIQTINNDTSKLSFAINQLVDIFTSFFAKLGFLGYVFILNPWLALYLVGQMIIVFVMNNFRIKYGYKRRKTVREKNEKSTAIVGEIVKGIRDVKSLNLGNAIINKSADINDDIKKYEYKTSRNLYFYRVGINWMTYLMEFGFIALTIYLVTINNIDPVSALTMYMFKGQVSMVMTWLVSIKEQLKEAELSSERINRILENTEFGFEEFGKETLNTTSPKSIEFRNVNFSYNESKQILNNLSFKIKPNTTVGIVGESGEGKSTLIKLLSKMYDINSGGIYLNDKELSTLDKDSIRNNISIVPQDPYIFNFSFKENLKLVKPEASDDEIEDVCKKAQIHDFIIQQEKGYDTILGENGIILSGGQKQRLAIARALLRNTPIILFDEATSSLDNENQARIKNVIANLGGEKTIVIVAHRLSTIQDADKIIFIKNGSVLTEGKHKALMKNCEEYKKLYKTEDI